VNMNARQLVRISECRRKLRSGEARELRVGAQMSLSEVARAAGISRTAAWRYENGARTPRPAQALRYARVLELLEDEVAR